MTYIRKSLFYISILTLGFTAACASSPETVSDANVADAPAVESATAMDTQNQTPIDITLDDGKTMISDVKQPEEKPEGFGYFSKEEQTAESKAMPETPETDVKTETETETVQQLSTATQTASLETEKIAKEEVNKVSNAVNETLKQNEKPFYHRETIVSRKVTQLNSDLSKVTDFVNSYDEQIADIQRDSEIKASQYYSLVAAIQSRLQGGSTPGNPILVEQMQEAQKQLDSLASSVGELNKLSNEISSNASVASFLLESVRATYNLSGAVEEDHKRLTTIEDDLNSTIVRIDRQLNNLSDDVNRRASYLATERRNLQTLALAVANGEPYGQSLARKAFGPVSTLTGVTGTAKTPTMNARPQATRPMIIIRFDRPKVDYQQALYLAASETLEKYPDANFEIVAVTPARGNAAQRALASSDARQNAEDVFRTLVEMGVPSSRVKLAAAQSPSAGTTEVHIFLR